jgi:hypothetical protein
MVPNGLFNKVYFLLAIVDDGLFNLLAINQNLVNTMFEGLRTLYKGYFFEFVEDFVCSFANFIGYFVCQQIPLTALHHNVSQIIFVSAETLHKLSKLLLSIAHAA